MSRTLITLMGCVCIAVVTARARVELPSLITDNMVLQAHAKVPVWGVADPNEQVTVTVESFKAASTAGSDGRWKIEIGPLEPGGPFEMTIAGTNTIVIHNVLVGEVWVCSGQSNMEFHLSVGPSAWQRGVLNYEQEIASAHYPLIRMFTVEKTVAGLPQRTVKGRWEIASPATVGHFSAVGYFFGLNLSKVLHEPIGLIHSSWAGTPAESWTTSATLASDPDFKLLSDDWQDLNAKYPEKLHDFEAELDQWKKASSKAAAEERPLPAPPKVPDDPKRSGYRPSGLFNGMIAPLIPYEIKGVIWYQGEENAGRGYQYRKLFPALIRDWRTAWGEGDFPFLFVQLTGVDDLPPESSFPLVREAQLMTLSLPMTAMAVTTDISEASDVHAKNKQEVGRRLALAAQALAYGQKIAYSGPIYSSMNIEGDKIRLHFQHIDGGLIVNGANNYIHGFEVAGQDHKFYGGVAVIDGDTVVVHSDQVRHPAAVRYAWRNYPVANLFNESGLPASPFRTDDWHDPK